MWDQRYSEPGWAYGTEPNDFLVETAGLLPAGGRVLCLAEGEGRNAVFLAGRGHRVVAVDGSAVGLAKARQLATERGVEVATVVADLATWDLGEGCWDGIVSIWAHLPVPARVALHRRVVAALAPGGVLLLEAYTPAQLALGTGGPPTLDRLVDPDGLRAEVAGLTIDRLEVKERDVHEGSYHLGRSAVVQLVAHR